MNGIVIFYVFLAGLIGYGVYSSNDTDKPVKTITKTSTKKKYKEAEPIIKKNKVFKLVKGEAACRQGCIYYSDFLINIKSLNKEAVEMTEEKILDVREYCKEKCKKVTDTKIEIEEEVDEEASDDFEDAPEESDSFEDEDSTDTFEEES